MAPGEPAVVPLSAEVVAVVLGELLPTPHPAVVIKKAARPAAAATHRNLKVIAILPLIAGRRRGRETGV